ncbi:MAG: DUF4230 domain-containing protein [Gemmataceae bacterium]
MFRTILSLTLILALAGNSFADGKLPLVKALPYVQAIHQVLDTLTTRESPSVVQAKKIAAETPSEWVVYRVTANVWVERHTSNYLGEAGVKISIPCQIEFGLDLAMLTPEHYRFDKARRLLVVDLPPVRLREPAPNLAEMKVESTYKGLRNGLLDGDAVRGLQAAALREDYRAVARDVALTETAAAQRRARDLMQTFLSNLFRDAGADIEVIVR